MNSVDNSVPEPAGHRNEVALTVMEQATIAQSRTSRRPSGQVSLVILLRNMVLSAVVAAIISALLHQFGSMVLWLGAGIAVVVHSTVPATGWRRLTCR
jgi:hypothetical protein